jgi:hypothetical protein
MQHALEYERETQWSSRTLLRSTLNALILSDSDWDLIAAHYRTERYLPNFDHRRLLCSDIHIATLFGLCLYVEEALAQSPAILTTYVESFTSIMPLGSVPRRLRTPRRRPPLQRLSGASLLATATYGSIIRMHHLPEQSKMLGLLAGALLSPRLNDSDMLVAIRHLTETEITALLVKFPSGQLKLRPSLLCHRSRPDELYVTSRGEHDTDFTYNPLWAIGERIQDSIDIHEHSCSDPEGPLGILDLFLRRGEDINSKCGPAGTFLHASVRYFCLGRYDPFIHEGWPDIVKTFLGNLIARGADLKATGPHGNVLEYTWKQAHIDYRPRHPHLIKLLVDLEVPNSICDPNGQVPSRESMLAVSEENRPDALDMSLYYYGIPTRSEEWQQGKYGKLERRPQLDPRGGIDAEDTASMQSTIPMPDPSSGKTDQAFSRYVSSCTTEGSASSSSSTLAVHGSTTDLHM